MELLNMLIEKAMQNRKTIILSETHDDRIIEASKMIIEKDFCKLILIGKESEIQEKGLDINNKNLEIINPNTYEKTEYLSNQLYELRKEKGMTLEQANEKIKDYTYFATMLVKVGVADGLVCGATHSTADTLRPALQIVKAKKGEKTVSAFSIMEVPEYKYGESNVLFFADTGLIENPTSEQLASIAIQTANSYRNIMGMEPNVAMLSYSTYGSAKSELTEKVIDATKIAKEEAPYLNIDGELQLDAAIVERVGKSKAPESKVAGKANVLVFPDLNCGNIGYKIVERLANANAYGPITQGMAKPINDLSRGCNSMDIVGAVAITCLQANNN